MTMSILMHGHHADNLFTVGRELDERIAQIKAEKPAAEQALRLALIQDVTALLPQTKAWAALAKAEAAYVEAWAAYVEARAALDKARAALDKARAAYDVSFDTEAFHREHCHPNCPWDGHSINSHGWSINVLTRTKGEAHPEAPS